METNIVEKIQSAAPVTKADIAAFASDICQKLDDGELSGIELLKNFKMIEKLQEAVKESMMKAALNEADKYPGKDFMLFGVTFRKAEVGTAYDYSGCGDEMMKNILDEEKKLKEEKKKREDFLKAIDGSTTVVDEDTGECITLYPPAKNSTSSLQVIIK